MGELTEPERRRHALARKLEEEYLASHKEARKLEQFISILFWLQFAAGGAASLMGLTRFEWVEPWKVSVAAGIATGCALVVRVTRWRAKADWFYARRDIAFGFLNRLQFEMPEKITNENVAAISKEYRQQQQLLGLRMTAINADNFAGSTPNAEKESV